jgi:hypothetical protein
MRTTEGRLTVTPSRFVAAGVCGRAAFRRTPVGTEYINTKEAAEHCRCSVTTIRNAFRLDASPRCAS